MFKYNRIAENLESYKIPSTTNYKYKMDIGEWTFPPHNSVLKVVNEFTNLYTYGVVDNEFTTLLNEIKKYNNLSEQKDTVLLTNGSDNALRLILDLFATEESKILVPIPSYVHFECMLDTKNIKQIDKPYTDYKLSNDEFYNFIMSNLTKQYDLCYLVNPSMPLGHMLSHQQIKNILSTYSNTVFIVDEAYVEFTQNESLGSYIEDFNNLIVVRTFSKFFGLASLRLGYLMTNEKFIKLLKPYYNYKDITKLAVSCALETLKNIDYYNNNKKIFFEIKDFSKKNLQELVNNNDKFIDYVLNDGMFFTLICKDPAELKKFFDLHSIAVRNKDSDIKGAVRFTMIHKNIMEEVFEILKKY